MQRVTAINRRRSAASLMPKRMRRWQLRTEDWGDFLMKAMFLDLIGLRLEVWNRLFSNRLFSRDKKYNRSTENMVIIGSTQNTCWYVDYKIRTSWIAFNAFSRVASTSVICCLSSSTDPGIFSRLLQMAVPSLTLVSSSCFVFLMALGIWARLDLWQ